MITLLVECVDVSIIRAVIRLFQNNCNENIVFNYFISG